MIDSSPISQSLDPEQKQIYPRIPFLALVSCLEDPRLDEGFEDITKIDFEVGLICSSLAKRDHRVMKSDNITVEWHGRRTGNLEKVLAVTRIYNDKVNSQRLSW